MSVHSPLAGGRTRGRTHRSYVLDGLMKHIVCVRVCVFAQKHDLACDRWMMVVVTVRVSVLTRAHVMYQLIERSRMKARVRARVIT